MNQPLRNHQKPGFLRWCEMDFATLDRISSDPPPTAARRIFRLSGWADCAMAELAEATEPQATEAEAQGEASDRRKATF